LNRQISGSFADRAGKGRQYGSIQPIAMQRTGITGANSRTNAVRNRLIQSRVLVHRITGSARSAQLLYRGEDGEPSLLAAEVAPDKQLICTLGRQGTRRFAVVSQQYMRGAICVLWCYHGPIPTVCSGSLFICDSLSGEWGSRARSRAFHRPRYPPRSTRSASTAARTRLLVSTCKSRSSGPFIAG
jgi:hypothetical protein